MWWVVWCQKAGDRLISCAASGKTTPLTALLMTITMTISVIIMTKFIIIIVMIILCMFPMLTNELEKTFVTFFIFIKVVTINLNMFHSIIITTIIMAIIIMVIIVIPLITDSEHVGEKDLWGPRRYSL